MKRRISAIARLERLVALRLPEGSGKRAVAVVALGSLVGQVSALLASPVLTRIYSPADFGVLAVYTGILTISAGLGGLKYEQAIPIAESEGEARALAVVAIVVTVLLAPLVGLVGSGYAKTVTTVAMPWLALVSVGFAALGLYQVLSFLAVRHRQYDVVGRTRAAQGLSMSVVQVGLGATGGGAVGLVIGHILGQAAGVGSLLSRVRSTAGPNRANSADVREVLHKFRKFPQFRVLSSALNSAGLQVPSLLIAWRYGVDAAGMFMLAQRVTEVPMRLLGQSINQVFFAEAAALRRNGSASGLALLTRTAGALSRICVPPLVALGLLAPLGAAPVFGTRWSEVGFMVPLLLPMVAAQFISSPAAQLLVAYERQELMMMWDAGRVGVVLVALGLLPLMDVQPRVAIAVYSVAGTALYALLYVLAVRASRGGTACEPTGRHR